MTLYKTQGITTRRRPQLLFDFKTSLTFRNIKFYEIGKVSFKQPVTSSWLHVLRKVSYKQPATFHREKLDTILIANYIKIIGNYEMHSSSVTEDYTTYLVCYLYLLIINIPFSPKFWHIKRVAEYLFCTERNVIHIILPRQIIPDICRYQA